MQTQLTIAAAASSAALILSLLLMVVGKHGRGLPGCGATSGCGTLARGRWSRWLGIPTVALALPVYLAVLIGVVAVPWAVRAQVALWPDILRVLAIWGAGSAVWFLALQAWVVRRYCVYCLLIHACGVISAGYILRVFPVWPVGNHVASMVLGGMGLAALIGGQLLLPGTTFALESSAPVAPRPAIPPVIEPLPAVVAAQPSVRELTHRQISLLSGTIVLAMDDWPLLGTPNARQVVAWLRDYTCQECHHLNRLLYQAVEMRQTTLAVMLLPVPQHSLCNDTVQLDTVEHAMGCPYARLGMALWVASPAAYRQWDEFLRKGTEPQSYGAALVKARQLADLSRYQFNAPDEALDAKIKAAVKIHRQTKIDNLPVLILPTATLRGRVPDVATLLKVIDGQFRPPPQIIVRR